MTKHFERLLLQDFPVIFGFTAHPPSDQGFRLIPHPITSATFCQANGLRSAVIALVLLFGDIFMPCGASGDADRNTGKGKQKPDQPPTTNRRLKHSEECWSRLVGESPDMCPLACCLEKTLLAAKSAANW